MMTTNYRKDIDVLKGLAILCVIFYHLGILKSGYLAVDLFFVISGFLTVPSVCKHVQNGDFSYRGFIKKKLIRLLPLVLLSSVVCLVAGAWGMLPDHYENLAQSVFASNILSENILSSITSKNYWNVLNDYKPLMHLWYVGVLFEFYLVFPILALVFNKFANRKKNIDSSVYSRKFNIFLIVLCVISILFYLNPFNFGINPLTMDGIRFYWLQNRFFELGLGGLIGLNMGLFEPLGRHKWLSPVSFGCLFAVVLIGLCSIDADSVGSRLPVVGAESDFSIGLILPPTLLLFLTVFFGCLVVAQNNVDNPVTGFVVKNRVLALLGKMSLSLYIWHQIIVAFYRYYYSSELSVPFVAVYLLAVLGISYLTYRFIEQKVQPGKATTCAILATGLITCVASIFIYLHAGVIRDVPELDISKNQIQRKGIARY